MNQGIRKTFRDDYVLEQAQVRSGASPFPFWEDKYMYSVNIEPHTKGPAGSVFEFPIDIGNFHVSG